MAGRSLFEGKRERRLGISSCEFRILDGFVVDENGHTELKTTRVLIWFPDRDT